MTAPAPRSPAAVIAATLLKLPLRMDSDDMAVALISALAAAGYRIVPVEPTEAMQEAGYHAVGDTNFAPDQGWREDAIDIYRAMIAAAEGRKS